MYQQAQPNPFDVSRFSALKLTFASAAPYSGGATGINLSILDLDSQANQLEELKLGAPTDIGAVKQAGFLLVGRDVQSASPSPLIQLYQREIVKAGFAVKVVGGPLNWQGLFEIWGLD